ncbi:MAG TPA: hypothetical protein VFT04_00675 [Gemmatimonadales bacterium]|nr:hypothetical protein [Gemmatimonadales bacterium]
MRSIASNLALAALVGIAGCAPGDAGKRADRPGAPCDPPAVWPQLPTVEAIAARPSYESGALADSLRTVRASDPEVPVPQYAFLQDADRTSCAPVIVVEAGREHVVYWGVDLTSNGIAPRDRVEFLGTDRAAASR